ncbi:MAG: hypothetical protein V9H69_10585 [Anaerolineae bacterium]
MDARGIIVAAPPIARKFIGQPAKNLGSVAAPPARLPLPEAVTPTHPGRRPGHQPPGGIP